MLTKPSYKDRKAYAAWWRRANPDKLKKYAQTHKTKNTERNRARRAKVRAQISELKTQPCVDCGQQYPPIVMDFDHVRGIKTDALSLMSDRAWSTIMLEVEKCDVVCANCHRIRTWHRSKKAADV